MGAVQVAVPQANMEEILPAARLLSRATAVTPSDYERAKTLFLTGLHNAGIQAQVFISPPPSNFPLHMFPSPQALFQATPLCPTWKHVVHQANYDCLLC